MRIGNSVAKSILFEVDSLRIQAADHYLITGPNSRLKLFPPAFVAQMTPIQLEEVPEKPLGSEDLNCGIGNASQHY
jgi:hypothetical protein